MGIRLLNTLIKNNCNDIVEQKHLCNFRNKKIVIDISIYAWRYLSENALIEKIYLMCLLFRQYKIIPIFIFDGKAPKEKQNTINDRKEKREEAKKQLLKLQEDLSLGKIEEKNYEIQKKKLLKRSVSLTMSHINILKSLIKSIGYTYIEASGEADVLCAQLSKNNSVFACLSEDTDMFAYQCPHIIRYISLSKHTVLFYDIKKILKKLNMSSEEFNTLCMLSSNDYNNKSKNIYYYYNKFIKFKNKKCYNFVGFIEWLKIKKYINSEDIMVYESNKKLYNLDKVKIKLDLNFKRDDKLLKEILKKDNFIYVE